MATMELRGEDEENLRCSLWTAFTCVHITIPMDQKLEMVEKTTKLFRSFYDNIRDFQIHFANVQLIRTKVQLLIGIGRLQDAIKCGHEEFIKGYDIFVEQTRPQEKAAVEAFDKEAYKFHLGNALSARVEIATVHGRMKDLDGGLRLI